MSSLVLHRIDGPSVRFESPLYRAVPAITTHACHSISDVGHTSAVLSLFRRPPLSGSFLPFFHNPLPFPLSALFLRCHQPRARAVYSVALYNELGTVYTMQIEFPLHGHPTMSYPSHSDVATVGGIWNLFSRSIGTVNIHWLKESHRLVGYAIRKICRPRRVKSWSNFVEYTVKKKKSVFPSFLYVRFWGKYLRDTGVREMNSHRWPTTVKHCDAFISSSVE